MEGIKGNISLAFTLLSSQLLNTCPDPKQLGDNLENSMSAEERNRARISAVAMAIHAENAINSEKSGDHKTAMDHWRKIFPDFPLYG